MFLEFEENDFDGHSPVYIMQQMQNLGYNTHNPIANIGSIGVFIAYYVARLIILFTITKKISKNYKNYSAMYDHHYNQLIFG
jgi:signal transduction histidine kinase